MWFGDKQMDYPDGLGMKLGRGSSSTEFSFAVLATPPVAQLAAILPDAKLTWGSMNGWGELELSGRAPALHGSAQPGSWRQGLSR